MRYAKTFFAALAFTFAAAWVATPTPAPEPSTPAAVCDGFGHCWMEIDGQGEHVI
jgi:hypothetical protein